MAVRPGTGALSLRALLLSGAWFMILLLPCGATHGDPGRYALLVGCTKYQQQSISELYGPANDVTLLAGLLENDFGFSKQNIKRLVGWPAEVAERPTYGNIAKEFEDLIARVKPDDRVVVLLSGHGTQTPIPKDRDPFDPRNPEPDGLDELFLPADVKSWESGGLANSLRDDQVGAWLERLRERGAAVWIIFDCCHSGTMTRGKEEVERPRQVKPQDLEIPEELIRAAVQRAQQALRAGKRGGTAGEGNLLEVGPLGLAPKKGGKGSVAAFYAAQPFETAPEAPRPRGAPAEREYYFGLLTYMLASTLQQRQSPLTYRELAQVLASRYQAERPARGPTPCFEGDLDREVLGLRAWPGRSTLLLKRVGGALVVTKGDLHGLTPGSILAVHPPAGSAESMTEVLGHVQVVKTTPLGAVVLPCEHQGKPAVGAKGLPELARCTVKTRELGELRITVSVHAAGAGETARVAMVEAALKEVDPSIRELFRVSGDEDRAEWLLWVEGARVQWRRNHSLNETAAAGTHFGDYPVKDVKKLTWQLARDIQTICTWQNIWRVAGTAGNHGTEDNPYGLKLEVVKLLEDDAPGEPLVGGARLPPGQRISFQLTNTGTRHLWVSLLFLDGNLGIKLRSAALQAGASFGPIKGTISGESSGAEGLVVLATAQDVHREQPSFDFLEQEGLGMGQESTSKERAKQVARAPQTPFGSLLVAAVVGKGHRSFSEGAATNPVILSSSWITLPVSNAKK